MQTLMINTPAPITPAAPPAAAATSDRRAAELASLLTGATVDDMALARDWYADRVMATTSQRGSSREDLDTFIETTLKAAADALAVLTDIGLAPAGAGNPDLGRPEMAEPLVELAVLIETVPDLISRLAVHAAAAVPEAPAGTAAAPLPDPTTVPAGPGTPTPPARTPPGPVGASRTPPAGAPMIAAPPAAAAPFPPFRIMLQPAATIFGSSWPKARNLMVPTFVADEPLPGVPDRDPHYRFRASDIELMVIGLKHRRNLIATGDPGCGKTEFFRQFAARTNMPFVRVPMNGELRRADLVGSFRQVSGPTGSSTPFVDGLLPRAIARPGLVLFDEIDQTEPDNHYLLHEIYEGGGLTIFEDAHRHVARHPHCHIAAAANTKGQGSETGLTHVRYQMSEATRDRFAFWLDFTYLPAAEETQVIALKTGLRPEMAAMLVQIANLVRDGFRSGSVAQPCSTRQLLDSATLACAFSSAATSREIARAARVVIARRASNGDAAAIDEWIRAATAVNLDLLDD